MSAWAIRLAWRLWAFVVWPLPPPGYSIVILGLVAAIVTLWPPSKENRWGRASLVFAFAVLSGLEMWAISHDRAKQDRLHEQDVQKIDQQFFDEIHMLHRLRLEDMPIRHQHFALR